MRRFARAVVSCALLPLLLAAAPAWDPAPWLADLGQIRTAIDRDYPNRDWLTVEREVSLDRWFDRAAGAIRASRNDADARRALDRLIERFKDGHLALHWPAAPDVTPPLTNAAPATPMSVSAFCAARGFDAGQVSAGTAAALPGYRGIDGGGPFRAGLVGTDASRAGASIRVIRVGVFSPQGYPALCEQVVASARIALDKPCDAGCEERLSSDAHGLMTRGLMQTVERLRAAGAQVLLVDLTRNGGGMEWAEAAARIVSPVPLRSAPIGVIRGTRWVDSWRQRAAWLRKEARHASPADRALLIDVARQADGIADGLAPCAAPSCSPLAKAGFATGPLATLPAGRLAGRTWAAGAFNAAKFPYRDSVWQGPVIVLVDDETWSAAEQFTALLQDNDAAIVMGTRTGGAGCGHLDFDEPITLVHSGAKLEMPNCARFRKDGSNEVGGIVPDVPTGVRWNDGPGYAARLTAGRLAEAVSKAQALASRRERRRARAE
ncbi:S41 family peptidase [Sphingomonas sp. RT2P30]|uniref:S41 family peptidase n=1 Tax=Parasphingomonas halimpatiens TaxID=3096162 RepID=UPI002FC5FF63